MSHALDNCDISHQNPMEGNPRPPMSKVSKSESASQPRMKSDIPWPKCIPTHQTNTSVQDTVSVAATRHNGTVKDPYLLCQEFHLSPKGCPMKRTNVCMVDNKLFLPCKGGRQSATLSLFKKAATNLAELSQHCSWHPEEAWR